LSRRHHRACLTRNDGQQTQSPDPPPPRPWVSQGRRTWWSRGSPRHPWMCLVHAIGQWWCPMGGGGGSTGRTGTPCPRATGCTQQGYGGWAHGTQSTSSTTTAGEGRSGVAMGWSCGGTSGDVPCRAHATERNTRRGKGPGDEWLAQGGGQLTAATLRDYVSVRVPCETLLCSSMHGTAEVVRGPGAHTHTRAHACTHAPAGAAPVCTVRPGARLPVGRGWVLGARGGPPGPGTGDTTAPIAASRGVGDATKGLNCPATGPGLGWPATGWGRPPAPAPQHTGRAP
jgi:hypothetical protein